jgi:ABC-type transport system involved in multi-copper enzyme maturation permease subunit
MSKAVPSTMSVLLTLIGVTWRRLFRGRALWILAFIAAGPAFLASLMRGNTSMFKDVATVVLLVMALLPSVFVASSIGEEIEDRTTTYLWSRPLPRWAVIVGKLLALAPLAAAMVAGSWVLAIVFAPGMVVDPVRTTLAFAAGAIAISVVAAGIALLVPRHGMALSIVYLVIIDMIIGVIPASLQTLSVTRQVRVLVGIEDATSLVEPAITMIIIAAVWLGVGLIRLRRLET